MEQHRWYEFSSVKIESVLTNENVASLNIYRLLKSDINFREKQ